MVAIAEEKLLGGKESCSSSTSELYPFDSSMEMFTSSDESVTCVSGVLKKELKKERELASKRRNMKQLVAAAQKQKKNSSQGDLSADKTVYDYIDQIPSNVSVEIEIDKKGRRFATLKSSMKSSIDLPSNATRTESSMKPDRSKIATPLNITPLGPHTKTPVASQRRVSITVPDDFTLAPPATPNIVNISGPDEDSSIESQNHPTSGVYRSASSGRVPSQHFKCRRSSVSGAGRREGTKMATAVDQDKVDSLLCKICSQPWFPKESLSGREITVDSVLEVLCKYQKTNIIYSLYVMVE